MSRHIYAAFASLCLLPSTAHAKEGDLTLGGNIRARVESIDGQFRPATADSGALLLRTSINIEYDMGPVRVGGEVQDSRVYFERQPSSIGTTEVNTFEPVQAYLVTKIGGNTELQVGRMTMDIGSRRFVSRQNFRNTTNAFTGARLDWRPTKNDGVTLFWTMPQDRLPNDKEGIRENDFEFDKERSKQQFFGARAVTAQLLSDVSLEGYTYRLVERDAENFATRNRRLWTTGLRLLKAPDEGRYDFEVEAAWQNGKTRASTSASDRTDLDVRAYFVHANLGHTFATTWSPRIALAYDLASGDGRGKRFTRFDTLFGARVFEFGPSSLYGPIGRANLSSGEVRLEVKPSKRWDGYVATRGLWLHSATDSFSSTGLRDVTGRSGHYAGTQFDARARYWLVPKSIRMSAGAALLAKGRFLEAAPRAPSNGDTRYGYFEVSYAF